MSLFTKKLIAFFSLFFFLFSHSVQGAILIKAPQASSEAFNAYLITHPRSQAYSQKLLKKQPFPEQLKGLSAALTTAQQSYLNQSLPQAKSDFLKLVGFALLADWKLEQRKSILYGYLRLAQIETNSQKKNQWLLKAARFSMGLIPNKELFPPAIIRHYKSLQKSGSNVLWKLPKKGYKYILVNGRKFNVKNNTYLSLPQGPIRMTFLSDVYAPESYVMLSSDLKEGFTLKRQTLVEGTCAQYRARKKVSSTKIFFHAECIKSARPKKVAVQKPDQWISSPVFQMNDGSADLMSLMNDTHKKATANKGHFLKRNKWVIIGVAALAAGWALSSHSSSSNVQSSKKQGFE